MPHALPTLSLALLVTSWALAMPPKPGEAQSSASQTNTAAAAAVAKAEPERLALALAGCRVEPLQERLQDLTHWYEQYLLTPREVADTMAARAASGLQVHAVVQYFEALGRVLPGFKANLGALTTWLTRLKHASQAQPTTEEPRTLHEAEALKANLDSLDRILRANLASAERHGRELAKLIGASHREPAAPPEVLPARVELASQGSPARPPSLSLDLTGEGYTLAYLDGLVTTWNEHPVPLQHLTLSGNPIGPPGDSTPFENFLARNLALRSLRLGHCELGDAMALRVCLSVLHHPDLVDLDLSGNDLTDAGGIALAALLAGNTQLQKLDLRGNRFQESAFNALVQAVAQHPRLTEVKVSSYDPRSVGYQQQLDQILAARRNSGPRRLPGRRFVQNLDWAGQQLTLSDLAGRIDGLHQDPIPVEHLTLDHNPLGQDGDTTRLEAFLAQNLGLRSLTLNHCGLSDAMATGIGLAVLHLPSLEVLALADNQLTDASGVALASLLASNTSLKELDLSGNRFDRNTFRLLVQAVGRHPNLRVVKVRRALDANSETVQRLLDQILMSRQ